MFQALPLYVGSSGVSHFSDVTFRYQEFLIRIEGVERNGNRVILLERSVRIGKLFAYLLKDLTNLMRLLRYCCVLTPPDQQRDRSERKQRDSSMASYRAHC